MKKSLVILFFICGGIVFGSLISHFAKDVSGLGWLAYGMNFGLTTPFVLDLKVITLTLGFAFCLDPAIIICVVLMTLAGCAVASRISRKR